MPAPGFVHLHLHTEFSLIDSTIRVPEKPDNAKSSPLRPANLLSHALALGLPALAVTDMNNLFALIKFYKAAYAVGIKPIAGADLWVATPEQAAWPMTLLCRDHTGYLSLSRLITRAWLEGHQSDGRVAINPEWLAEHHQHLFAILGRRSLAGRWLAEGREDCATREIQRWRHVFAEDCHLELTRTGRSDEDAFNRFALDVASQQSIPVIASNDVRFLTTQDFAAHEARVCIAAGYLLNDPKRPKDYTDQQYLRSTQEMTTLFADIPDALANATALAARCNIELPLGTSFLPAYPVPSGETLDTWIRSQANEGLTHRLDHTPPTGGRSRQTYQQRLAFELDTIIQMGFSGYFLIVADFIQWAKQQGIPIGPGRGSGAGSLVAWALHITDLDPLPYHLLFERFLNPERVSLPDFDIDFCMDRRDEVIQYVAQRYGRDRVSQIITYGTMAAKAVVRDSGRVLGFPYGLVDGVAKLIPNMLGISLKDALGEGQREMASPELIQRYHSEDDVRELLDLARQLENLTRNAGKHAGGVVIAPKPLTEFCPLFAERGEHGQGKNPVTQFDKNDVEAVGLVKFDFLGLRTLTIIDWTVKAIHARSGQPNDRQVEISKIPLDDAPTYHHIFAKGQTGAVFQFESTGMRRLLKEARPDRFEDLIALVSLYRPGPMDLIPAFVARKHGREPVTYPDQRVEPILQETYGIMVYQEQVMQMAQIVGGYSLGGADLLRRAMGKKVPAEMAKHRAIFRAGAHEGGMEEAVADQVFDLMEKFAGYGFNKSHAAAYALVSYQTAWLKQHYPAEFMAATLSSDMDNTDKVVGFLDEVRHLGLTLRPPHLHTSDYHFTAANARTIHYGLGAIKGVGQAICHSLVRERKAKGPYQSLYDLCVRLGGVKLNRRTLEALIQAGALDGLAANRASLIAQIPSVFKATEQLIREQDSHQSALFASAMPDLADAFSPALITQPEWPIRERLAAERQSLGFYLSGHPFDPYRAELQSLISTDLSQLGKLAGHSSSAIEADESATRRRPEKRVVVAGMVTGIRRRGDSQLFFQLEDGRGRLDCAAFADVQEAIGPILARDRVCIVQGGLREDEFNGGYSLRVRQCWDYESLCRHHADRLILQLDLRQPTQGRQQHIWQRLDSLLKDHRSGKTTVYLSLIVPSPSGDAIGTLALAQQDAITLDSDLLESLRAEPAFTKVQVRYQPPWVTTSPAVNPASHSPSNTGNPAI